MMNKTICLLLAVALFSCKEKIQKTEIIDDENITAHQIDSILTEFKFQYESPVFMDSADFILIPISTKLLKRRTTFSKDGYYSDDYPRYWNILFYNKNSGDTKLLTESKLRISDFNINIKDAGHLLSKSIIYRIGDTDYNDDNKLDNLDPEQLFISNDDGSNLRRLSPINEHLQSYTIIPNSDQIIASTRRDVNGDSIFDNEDELIWYHMKLNENIQPKEIVDTTLRTKIENLYFEQWLKKK